MEEHLWDELAINYSLKIIIIIKNMKLLKNKIEFISAFRTFQNS